MCPEALVATAYMGPEMLVAINRPEEVGRYTWVSKRWSLYLDPITLGAIYAWVSKRWTLCMGLQLLVVIHGAHNVGRYTWPAKRWSLCIGPKTLVAVHESQNVGRYAWVPNVGCDTWVPKNWSLHRGPKTLVVVHGSKTRWWLHMGSNTIVAAKYIGPEPLVAIIGPQNIGRYNVGRYSRAPKGWSLHTVPITMVATHRPQNISCCTWVPTIWLLHMHAFPKRW